MRGSIPLNFVPRFGAVLKSHHLAKIARDILSPAQPGVVPDSQL